MGISSVEIFRSLLVGVLADCYLASHLVVCWLRLLCRFVWKVFDLSSTGGLKFNNKRCPPLLLCQALPAHPVCLTLVIVCSAWGSAWLAFGLRVLARRMTQPRLAIAHLCFGPSRLSLVNRLTKGAFCCFSLSNASPTWIQATHHLSEFFGPSPGWCCSSSRLWPG